MKVGEDGQGNIRWIFFWKSARLSTGT